MGQVSARTDGQRRGGGRGASERRNERMSAKLGAPFQDGKLWEAVRGSRYLVEKDAEMCFVLLTHLTGRSSPKLICFSHH